MLFYNVRKELCNARTQMMKKKKKINKLIANLTRKSKAILTRERLEDSSFLRFKND